MSWRDKILAGSFRGVPFVAESADGELGRRIALHEYPLRDKPYAEDLGRKARRFTLDLYIVGTDYMAVRDLMIKALEESGSGKLVHPYLGEMTVSVMEARGPRESTREGGMARFNVTFIETGAALFPSGATDRGGSLQAKATLAAEHIKREFAEVFNSDGPEWISDHAASLITKVTAQISIIKNGIPVLPAAALQFAAELATLATELETMVRTPADLAVAVYDIISNIALLPDRPARAIDAYRPLFSALAGEPDIVTSTPSRQQQADNQAAIIALTRRAAVVESCRAASLAEFASLDEAIAVRDELGDQLDEQMNSADDQTFASLSALRAELVRYVAANAGNLARLISYRPLITLPALVIAYRIYGDANRASDIIDRNHIVHPGFVPGGVELEVLTDA